MNKLNHWVRCILPVCLTVVCLSQNGWSQDSEVVELTLHARSVSKNSDSIRLLPREHELRDGNAAIELLRMPWEQTNFMRLMRKNMDDWLEMEGDTPELVKNERLFAHFKDKMRRAAYTRDADWDYPIGEQPLATILLPEVQGMRRFTGRIMSLWIQIQISQGDLREAEQGLLIQMACARHICRTPFGVCNAVGAAIANHGFDQLEDLVQHPKAENYYHALSMLPDNFADSQAVAEFNARLVLGSIPTLNGNSLPPIGNAKWKTAYKEFVDNYLFSSAETGNEAGLEGKVKIAAKDLSVMKKFTEQQLKQMSGEETVLRWVLFYFEQIGSNYIAAVRLPSHQALQALVAVEKEIDQFEEKFSKNDTRDDPKIFSFGSAQHYMVCHRTGRDAKLLQIVEAIRHHASQNGNRLPDSLAAIELYLPADPFTNQPAEYELKDGVAMLRWPTIPGVKDQKKYSRSYKIKMVELAESK